MKESDRSRAEAFAKNKSGAFRTIDAALEELAREEKRVATGKWNRARNTAEPLPRKRSGLF